MLRRAATTSEPDVSVLGELCAIMATHELIRDRRTARRRCRETPGLRFTMYAGFAVFRFVPSAARAGRQLDAD